jgi:hypothetical protein
MRVRHPWGGGGVTTPGPGKIGTSVAARFGSDNGTHSDRGSAVVKGAS